MARPKPIAYEILQPEEIDQLPERLKIRLRGAIDERDEWLLVQASWPISDIVGNLNRLADFISDQEGQLKSSTMLETLTSWLAADVPSLEKDLVYDNLVARRDYLASTPLLTAAQIHEISGLDSSNRSEPASRWQKEGKTFGIRIGQPFLYPAFQFRDGRPHEALIDILAALPKDMSAWQRAFWFASGNGWLNGDKPQQRLDDADSVVEAARQLSNPAHG